MKVRIKRVDKNLPLPKYETKGSVGFDLIVREDTVVEPYKSSALPVNIIVEIPDGYMLAVLPRSSTVRKTGLIIPNGFGVIDQDYHGPEDEIMLMLYNPTPKPIQVKRGERLGQGIFIKVEKAEWEETRRDLKDVSRGGLGSTG